MNKITQSISTKSRNSFKSFLTLCSFLLVSSLSFGQSNPTAHDLSSSSFTFTGFGAGTTTTYPTSMQGHKFPAERTTATLAADADGDRVLANNASLIGSGSIRNEVANGISLLNSGSNNIGAILVALNSTGRESLSVTFTAEQLTSGGNGATDRINGLRLQYRIGVTGSFTDVASTEYLGTNTTAVNGPQTFTSISLPSACNNQSVVHLRWIYYLSSGTANGRDRIRLDDITVSSSAIPTTVAPTVTTTTVSSITNITASSGGDVTADGGASVTARGVAFGTSANPTSGTSDGAGTGTFTSSLTSLLPNTQYYYRAFATNSVDTSYGTEFSFYTLANTPGVITVGSPQVTTLNVTVNATTENSNPTATVYALHETTTNQFVQADGTLGASAVWQTAATWSTITVTGLTQNTTYTFEAKARNQASVETSYGATASGTTLANQTPGWCNLQFPSSHTMDEGNTVAVYARVFASGITNSPGQGANLNAWIGYSTVNGTPDNTWTWIPAAYFGDDGANNDEYRAFLGTGMAPGTYYYVSRFQIGSGSYVYGGTNNNFWASTVNSGVLTINPDVVDYCNVAPSGTNNVDEGTVFTLYSDVYEPGITPPAGQGAGITAYIGYSSTSSDPSVGTWTWVAATFHAQSGNNDVYKIDLPSNLPIGTYSFASRYIKTGSSVYRYGGTSGNWNNDSGVLNVVSNLVDYCNVQFPLSGNITQGDAFNVYAQVYEPGVTPGAGQGAGITSWIGYSSSNVNPNDPSWTWFSATYNGTVTGNNDEYTANIAASLTPGTYYYASRFQKSGSTQFSYGGTNGVWNNDNGVLVVNQAIPVVTGGSPTGTVGVAFSYSISATNSPTSYAIASGTLPAGLSLNTTTGLIDGTPTTAGSASVDVTAANSGGTSTAATLNFTIAQGSQTITFGALAPKTIGDAPFALTATASSGLTVTYTSLNTSVATISGNTVTIVGAGTAIITASQVGDSNYTAATDVNQNLVVYNPVIAQFDFTPFSLPTATQVTLKDTNVSVTDFAISAGTLAVGQTAGSNFPNEPFVSGSTGYTSTTQAGAKNFNFTINANTGYQVEVTSVEFNALATSAGPSAISFDVASGTSTFTANAPDTALLSVNQLVSGVTNLTSVPVLIQGWLNGSRASSGGGNFRIDDVKVRGSVTCINPVAFTVTGGGTGCANTGVLVGLSGSQVGISYQLKDGATNVGSPVAGTGSAISFGNQLTAGTYTVEATNVACSLNLTMTGSATVTLTPIPTLDTITATPACINSPSSVTMTGLLPSTAGSFTYTNSFTGPVVYTVSGVSDASGNFSFDTPNLPAIANGAVITITSGTVTATGCTTTFSGKTVTVVVGKVTTWTGASWDLGAPTSIDTAVIASAYSEADDIDACTLTVNNNAVVVIPSGFNVTLNGAITVSSGSFTVNNNANLIQLTDVANSGNITVKRLSSAVMRQDYTIWSSPVTGQNLLAFSPNTLVTRFYNYNTTTNLYNAVPSPSTTDFAAGQGYLIRTPNAFPTTPTVWPGSFTGVPNNGTINVALSNVGAGQRFNAVGNPYPSAIDMNEFVSDNQANITGTLYFWRKTNNAPGNAYCTWTAGTFVTNNQAQVFDPNDVIRTGQGFLVEATATGTTLEFNNSQRTADNANQFFRTTSANTTTAIERNRMWLNLTNDSGDFHQMAVGYITDATQGVDRFDGKFFNDGAISLNSIVNNEKYVIQGRALPFDDTDVVPLSLTVTTAGNYTISIDHLDGFFSGDQRIFIKDKTNNSLYDLKASSFTFASAAGTFNDRFEIVYRNPKEANVQASQCGQTVSTLNQSIYANLVSGAQAYRFRVTNVATNEVQSIDRVLRVFNLTQLPNYAYDRTYTVEVAVKYNNVWQPFGNACQVTAPVAYTKVQTTQCGSQLANATDAIYADAVSYSTGYRFKITNTFTNQVSVLDKVLRTVKLSDIGIIQFDTDYLVEVAVRNTDGTYLPYGQVCTISLLGVVAETSKIGVDSVSNEFKVVAYPNPFGEQISFNIATNSQEVIQVKVYDMLGKLIESREMNAIEETEIQLGTSYTSGVYNVIVTQGDNTEIVRVIKR